MRNISMVILSVLVCSAISAVAQTNSTEGTDPPLFTNITSCVDCSWPPQVITQEDVSVNFELLKGWPDTIQIQSTYGLDFVADKSYFIASTGYIEDPNNHPLCDTVDGIDCEVIPDPNAPPEAFSYFWRGNSAQYDVYLTVKNGIMSGKIDGPDGRRVIRKLGNGYVLKHLDLSEFPPADPLELAERAIQSKQFGSSMAPVNDWKAVGAQMKGAPPGDYAIDVLVLYTSDAVAEAGGLGELLTEITAAKNETNDALALSGVDYRVAFWGPVEENSIVIRTDQPSVPSNINRTIADFTENLAVQNLRDAYGVDAVLGIIEVGEDDDDDWPVCGVAVTQRQDCRCIGCNAAGNLFLPAGCSLGAAFEPYAYAISQSSCDTEDDIVAHELGHTWGAEHNFTNLVQRDKASFPWSYGHFVEPWFETIMAFSSAPPQLVYSTPNAVDPFTLTPYGVVNEAENYRTFNQLGPDYALFRQRPDALFFDGFE